MLTTPAEEPKSKSASQSQNTIKAGAEVLVWLGTAYGRVRVPASSTTFASPMAHIEVPRGSPGYSRSRAAPLVLVAVGLALLAAHTARHNSLVPEPSETKVTAHAEIAAPPLAVPEPRFAERTTAAAASTSAELPAAATEESRRAAETLAAAAADLPSAPSSEAAPIAPAPIEARDLPENAEGAAAVAPRTQDHLPQIELAHQAAAPEPLQPASPDPVRVSEASIAEQPRITTPAHPTITGYAAGNADISAGQKHFANGDMAAARRAFTKALKAGHPEGALGLGTTYYPAAIQKAGLKAKADPALAQDWYRRAFELALSPKRKKG